MRDFDLSLLLLTLWTLALARITRLVVADRLTDFLRVWAYRRSRGAETYTTYFLQCPWCMSMWLGFASSPLLWLQVDWPWFAYPLVSLAGSYAVGLMAENLESDDDVDVRVEDD